MSIISLLSDLHLERYLTKFKWEASLRKTANSCYGTVILAGDICSLKDTYLKILTEFLSLLEQNQDVEEILYIPGNHEYYWCTREEVIEKMINLCKYFSKLRIFGIGREYLYFSSYLKSAIFLDTLWYPFSQEALRLTQHLNDFTEIKNWNPQEAFDLNARTHEMFEEAKEIADIFVFHHAPCLACVPEKFKQDPLQAYYVDRNLSQKILYSDLNNKLFLYGHYHEAEPMIPIKNNLLVNNATQRKALKIFWR